MSDNNLDIRARLSAVNEMSPALRKVLADVQKLEGAAKRFNAQFATMGRAGMMSMDGFNRAAKAAGDQIDASVSATHGPRSLVIHRHRVGIAYPLTHGALTVVAFPSLTLCHAEDTRLTICHLGTSWLIGSNVTTLRSPKAFST